MTVTMSDFTVGQQVLFTGHYKDPLWPVTAMPDDSISADVPSGTKGVVGDKTPIKVTIETIYGEVFLRREEENSWENVVSPE
jgi:hypothetical protein